MGQISVTFNETTYNLACKDGEEERLARLADYVNMKASSLAGQVGHLTESRLLLMTAILIADELDEARTETGSEPEMETPAMEVALDKATKRIEDLARSLETGAAE